MFVAAGVAGTLDILYAIIFWALKANVPPPRILQSVASGVLGPASFKGGSAVAALGLALHFLIALVMALTYYALAKYWLPLTRHPVLWGACYGLLLYGAMNYIVVPLSAALPGSKDPNWVGLSILVHMALIGVPIAFFAKRALA